MLYACTSPSCSRIFHACACGLDLVWLHLMPMRPCLDVTIWEASLDVGLLCTYPSLSALCNAMLTMFAYATCWLSMHLYTLAHMSMYESCLLVCCPCFNTMKLWTSIKTYICPSWTPPFVCFLACFLAFLFLCLPCLSCLSALCLFHMPFASFPSIAYLLVSCLCLCMYTYGAKTHGDRAQSPKCKQNGRRCKHVDISQATMFSRFRGLSYPIWLCTLLNLLPSSLLSFLDGLY